MKLKIDNLYKMFKIHFTSYKQIYNGADNEIFLLISDNNIKYILRHSLRKKIKQDIYFEQAFSKFLYDHHIPVRLILETGENTLLSYCDGKNIKASELTTDMAFNGGKTLALFHKVSKEFNKDILPKRHVADELYRALNIKEKIINKYTDGEIFIKQIQDILLNVPESNMIIHNDFRVQNVLFNKKNVSAILDFDWACIGNPIKDLGHAMVEWSYPDGGVFNINVFKAFFEGYKSIEHNIDINQLKYWIAFSCLSDTATYLVDTIDDKPYGEKILSWMYGKYLFFDSQNIAQLTE